MSFFHQDGSYTQDQPWVVSGQYLTYPFDSTTFRDGPVIAGVITRFGKILCRFVMEYSHLGPLISRFEADTG
eukprot:1324787-Amorphochlora_amoeboformis.AAC.1